MHFPRQVTPCKCLNLDHLAFILLSSRVSLNKVCVVDVDGLPTLFLQSILPKVFVICIFRLIVAASISHFELEVPN